MWKKFSKLLESRLLVEWGFKFSSLLLWSKVIRLLTEMEEFCLILVFKVVESRVRGWVVLSVVLLSLLLNEDKAEVVVLFGAVVVEEIGAKEGQERPRRPCLRGLESQRLFRPGLEANRRKARSALLDFGGGVG